MKRSYFILFLFLVSNLSANEGREYQVYQLGDETYRYEKPRLWDLTQNWKQAHLELFETAFSKEALPYWAAIISSSALTYYYDEEILLESQRFGRRNGIPNVDNTKTFISFNGVDVLRLPTDTGSWMYFIGDGWTQFAILNSFLGYGLVKNNYRSLQVAKQLTFGLLTSALGVQVLKRSTGRESPFVRTKKRGRWQLFPDQTKYSKNVPSYDAFPSGHVTTAMMTLTVISDNYPEYTYIKPVGYTLITLLSFQMLNNGVHWASDYPLAFGMGYLYGKMATKFGRTKIKASSRLKAPQQTSLILPFTFYGGGGVRYISTF